MPVQKDISMKFDKQMIFCSLVSLFLLLPLQGVWAKHAAEKTKPVEWLYVITSKKADITKNDKAQYELTLDHAHIERVLAFSDRPNRIVRFISPKYFEKRWGAGKNSFEKDPPNAIAVFGQEKIAMKLMSVSVDNDKTSFVISSDDDSLRPMPKVEMSLFIDSRGQDCSFDSCKRACTSGASWCNDPPCDCATIKKKQK